MRTLRIGTGAGFADDRLEPSAEPAEHGDLDYLVSTSPTSSAARSNVTSCRSCRR
jgi:hypothetical protein